MKSVIAVALFLFLGGTAFSQNDPSYSMHNYKHPDKAEKARKEKASEVVTMNTEQAEVNENYKNNFDKKEKRESIVIKQQPITRSNKSYKHPYGL